MKFKIIEVKEIKTKTGSTFNAFKTLDKYGKKMDVRFRKSAHNIPTEPCMIVVSEDNYNVDKNRQYPVLWISDVDDIEEFERNNDISEFFDVD